MHFATLCLGFIALPISFSVLAAPVDAYNVTNPKSGPIPGESSVYSTDYSVTAPWPGNSTGATLNTTYGPPGEDDLLFQNLLSAEWTIFSFYQAAVEAFNESSFVGYPNTTYRRIQEIRDNEAGHLRIFQDSITSNSIKPGPCKYAFPFQTAEEMLAFQTYLEVSSMAFLTGLILQAGADSSKGALMAIGQVEARHNVWSLIDIWNTDPFSGPADTVYPYANQILDLTKDFRVSGSCPSENPPYPIPSQNLPQFTTAEGTKSVAPGSRLVFNFSDPTNQPVFSACQEYHAVFFHGVQNISVPFDTKTNSTTIPAAFEELGIIIAVIADKVGAPTNLSVIAGPTIFVEQPAAIEVPLALI